MLNLFKRIAQLLIAYECVINVINERKKTTLHFATQKQNYEIYIDLIEFEINRTFKNNNDKITNFNFINTYI